MRFYYQTKEFKKLNKAHIKIIDEQLKNVDIKRKNKQTNFELIKAMTIEEMAQSKILCCHCCAYREGRYPCVDCECNCEEGNLKWLQQEVQDEREYYKKNSNRPL